MIDSATIAANGLAFVADVAGEGPDVALLLHGFPESRHSWRHQLPFLAGRGWRVIAPDLRGYGESARPDERDAYRIKELVADVGGLFDAVGARRRLLIGHDWGGAIAWAAAMGGMRLDGLVVMNAPHPIRFREVLLRSPRQVLRSWYMLLFQLPVLPERLLTAGRARAVGEAFRQAGLPAETIERYRQDALRPGAARAMLAYYRANVPGLLRRASPTVITTPTLLIWGEADVALGLELTEGLERFATDLTIERLPGVSHWVQQEVPDAVNARLGRWLTLKALPSG